MKLPTNLRCAREMTSSRPLFKRGRSIALRGPEASPSHLSIASTEYDEDTEENPQEPVEDPHFVTHHMPKGVSEWSEGAVTHLGEVELPTPEASRVKSAEYISSAVRPDQMPQGSMSEVAVIGRSNVGKSSLINALTHKKMLAHVSKTPGKTRTINHFLINDSWYLVDLPGYGFAKMGASKKMEWFGFTSEYFINRESLIMVLLLVDATVPVQRADVECLNWLAEREVPVSVVFTKIDKKKKKVPKPIENILAFEEEMAKIFENIPPTIATSSSTGAGKDKLLRYIASLRRLYGEK